MHNKQVITGAVADAIVLDIPDSDVETAVRPLWEERTKSVVRAWQWKQSQGLARIQGFAQPCWSRTLQQQQRVHLACTVPLAGLWQLCGLRRHVQVAPEEVEASTSDENFKAYMEEK